MKRLFVAILIIAVTITLTVLAFSATTLLRTYSEALEHVTPGFINVQNSVGESCPSVTYVNCSSDGMLNDS